MNKYIGAMLAFLAVIAVLPRLIAESRGFSLFMPCLFVLWAIGTFTYTLLIKKTCDVQAPKGHNENRSGRK